MVSLGFIEVILLEISNFSVEVGKVLLLR